MVDKNESFRGGKKMKIQIKYVLLLIFLCANIWGAFAQSSNELIRKGNKQYENGKYNESEISYRKSLEKKKNHNEGNFKLGDAFYKQGKFEEAAQQFRQIIASEKNDKNLLSKAYHNLGNSLLKTKKPEESIAAYKEALKLNPKDEETRYNLAYAQAQLKQQQQQNKDNKDNKDQKNNKDQKKDSKEDQKKQDQKDKNDKNNTDGNKNQDGKPNEKDQNKEQKSGNQPPKISKEDAQRILDALNNQEKDIQKKVSKKEDATGSGKIEKDW